MVGQKSGLDDEGSNGGGNAPLWPIAALVGVLSIGSGLKGGWEDIKYFVSDLLRGDKENEEIKVFDYKNDSLFCPAPGHAKNEWDMITDPFQQYMLESSEYEIFWIPTQDTKTVSIEFSKNAGSSQDKERFFDSIPQEVIDNEEIVFLLSGHATNYDTDVNEAIRENPDIRKNLTDDFRKISDRYDDINKRTVDRRLESIRDKLIEKGIAEHRIIPKNFKHRFNRRAVDIEVCFNGVPSDTPSEEQTNDVELSND